MKIFLVAPKSISRHRHTNNVMRYDYAVWNFFVPLMSLGHHVTFIDTTQVGEDFLKQQIESKKPDLLFCIMTGDPSVCPQEPWNTIKEETQKGRLTTFNWFCDDTWRFDDFSSKVCHDFHACSTPERHMVAEFNRVGHDRVFCANWHANADLYSGVNMPRQMAYTFCGGAHADRARLLENLRENDVPVIHPKDIGFEDMVWNYSRSYGGLNFTKNKGKTQMKARIFEVTACSTMLLTEYADGIEEYYVPDREIITFKSGAELVGKAKFLIKNPKVGEKIATAGYKRFLKNHQSKVRLSKTLESIKAII
tara:strand:- start:209 stop:1132 length:924 start_codon:yes stop_codon:yes gene_type:complete